MKPFLFLLLILPAGLNAQQTTVSTPRTQLAVTTTDFSASIANIGTLTLKINEISATIKSTREQISSLQSQRRKIKLQITDIQDQIKNMGSNDSKIVIDSMILTKDEAENLIDKLTSQLNEIDKKISELQNSLNAQIAAMNKLEDSIDQLRKKMEETAARERQLTESKEMEEIKKTVIIVEEKALAYAHVKIILDSLPPIGSRLSLAERNLVSGLNSRFNSDAEFRSVTMAYFKHSKARNYFGVLSKAGSSTDLINRLLNAAREELVILSRN